MDFDKVKSNLPLYSAVILVASLVRLIVYYDSFDINIVSYIDLTEAVVLTAPFFFYGFLILVAYAFIAVIMLTSGANLRMPEEEVPEGVWITKGERITFLVVFPIFAIILIVISDKYPLSYPSIFMMVSLVLSTAVIKKRIFNKIVLVLDVEANYIRIFLLGTSVMMIFIAFAKTQASFISTGTEYTKVEFTNDDVSIKANDTIRYVGKTKDYIFFYDRISKASKTYKLDNLKELTIKEEPAL